MHGARGSGFRFRVQGSGLPPSSFPSSGLGTRRAARPVIPGTRPIRLGRTEVDADDFTVVSSEDAPIGERGCDQTTLRLPTLSVGSMIFQAADFVVSGGAEPRGTNSPCSLKRKNRSPWRIKNALAQRFSPVASSVSQSRSPVSRSRHRRCP